MPGGGGGAPGGHFWTPKLHKEGKEHCACVHECNAF